MVGTKKRIGLRGSRSRLTVDGPFAAMLVVVFISVSIGIIGVALKARVLMTLPAMVETAAEAPTGILTFIDRAIDSWKPMELALILFRSSAENDIYGAIRKFQVSDQPFKDVDLSQFRDSKKFQYPLTSLLPIEALKAVGWGSIPQLNTLNLLLFLANVLFAVRLGQVVFGVPAFDPGAAWNGQIVIYLIGVGAALTYYPNFMALVKGNIQVWVNFVFSVACVAWCAKRFELAGAMIAVAAAIKPQFGAFLLWAVLWRQWKFCAGLLAVGLPIALFSVVYFGIYNNLAYFELLSLLSQRGEQLFLNESINGILHRLMDDGTAALVWDNNDYGPIIPVVRMLTLASACVFALVAFGPAVWRKQRSPTVSDFGAAALCFTLGSPIVWVSHYGILLPIFIIAFKSLYDEPASRRRSVAIAGLGLSWMLCASYSPILRLIYKAPYNVIANPRFFGALLLLVLVLRSAAAEVQDRRIARAGPRC